MVRSKHRLLVYFMNRHGCTVLLVLNLPYCNQEIKTFESYAPVIKGTQVF